MRVNGHRAWRDAGSRGRQGGGSRPSAEVWDRGRRGGTGLVASVMPCGVVAAALGTGGPMFCHRARPAKRTC